MAENNSTYGYLILMQVMGFSYKAIFSLSNRLDLSSFHACNGGARPYVVELWFDEGSTVVSHHLAVGCGDPKLLIQHSLLAIGILSEWAQKLVYLIVCKIEFNERISCMEAWFDMPLNSVSYMKLLCYRSIFCTQDGLITP
ncbi:hypothetical protein VNO77_03793 [Canavalia gladiata]|uniref:Uncharacterized protein n=1 Tax=Canavalia gladiata TaxID=3824 RepID=A0AAN9R489_CANGL